MVTHESRGVWCREKRNKERYQPSTLAPQYFFLGAASNVGAAAVQRAAERLLAALAAADADGGPTSTVAALPTGAGGGETVATAAAELARSFWAVRSRWWCGVRVAQGGMARRLERESRGVEGAGRLRYTDPNRSASPSHCATAAAAAEEEEEAGNRAAQLAQRDAGRRCGGGGGGPRDVGGGRGGGGGGGCEGGGEGGCGGGDGGGGGGGGGGSRDGGGGGGSGHSSVAAGGRALPAGARRAAHDTAEPSHPRPAGAGAGPEPGAAAGSWDVDKPAVPRCARGVGGSRGLGSRDRPASVQVCAWGAAGGGGGDGGGGGGGAYGGGGGGGGADQEPGHLRALLAMRMDAFFADARRRLAAVRRLFAAGDSAGIRAEARELARAAADAGARSVQDAAAKLWDARGSGGGAGWEATAEEEGPVRRAAVDWLELQMDAAEAIWRSCRIVV
jgi:hypothetical protein